VTSPTRLEITVAVIALLLSGLTASAQTAPPSPSGQGVSFDQFKAQRLQQLQRAQARLAQHLGSPDLPADQRQRLEHRQAQLANVAALPPEQQDAVLHRRFDRIDANHDGVIDRGERQAFRQQHRERARAKQDTSGPPAKSDEFWPSQVQN
jgi:hypothetical protein